MCELVNFRGNLDAEVNLICFHFAGGGANFFKPWSQYLPSQVGLFAVRLPGRETLFSEPPYQNIEDVLSGVMLALEPLLLNGAPIILLGHSMGGLVAFEVARALSGSGKLCCLCLSGYGHPLHLKKRQRHLLSDALLRNNINITHIQESQQLEDLINAMLPTLRNDYSVCDTYSYTENEILDIPIMTFSGEDDPIHNASVMKYWDMETNKSVKSFCYPGDHFFIRKYYPDMIKTILKQVRHEIAI